MDDKIPFRALDLRNISRLVKTKTKTKTRAQCVMVNTCSLADSAKICGLVAQLSKVVYKSVYPGGKSEPCLVFPLSIIPFSLVRNKDVPFQY